MSAAVVLGDESEPIAIWLHLDALQPFADQPRKTIDDDKLEQLTASIRARGRVIEPLVARPIGDARYEIICGERRWRAAKAAELSKVPVVVRDMSDEEAYEESLVENLDREDLVPIDEVRAVARLVGLHGVQETGRRIGKPHHWVSKRKRIAEAAGFVVDVLESGASSDIEAVYELAKLADIDVDAAQQVIANHIETGHLRKEVKAAARAARPDSGDDQDEDDESPNRREKRDVVDALSSEESFRLEDRSAAARSGDEEHDGDDDAERGAGETEGDDKPSWLPSDAPELDEPFDADTALLVTAVDARRAGHLVFTTSNGPVVYELTAPARSQLQALLGPS